MAAALTKSNLLSSTRHITLDRRRRNISVFPKSCNFSKSTDFHGKSLVLRSPSSSSGSRPSSLTIKSQTGLRIGKAQKWWEKGLQPNMKEVTSAQDLVESLLKAGDKLVVVDFFSPGCGGCKALHPKLCQLAEMNPEVEFLAVNYEEHKSMCYSLNVHVLPFFRFYRGAHGRLCSFSCTNATIKKFRDALAKHGPERCSLGPTKGLEEKELLALAANPDLSFAYTPKPDDQRQVVLAESETASSANEQPLTRDSEGKTLETAWR